MVDATKQELDMAVSPTLNCNICKSSVDAIFGQEEYEQLNLLWHSFINQMIAIGRSQSTHRKLNCSATVGIGDGNHTTD